METIVKHLYAHQMHTTKVSAWKKFIDWCISQEKYRLGWLAAALTLHGCVLTIFNVRSNTCRKSFYFLAIYYWRHGNYTCCKSRGYAN